jgi:hypothetical protein
MGYEEIISLLLQKGAEIDALDVSLFYLYPDFNLICIFYSYFLYGVDVCIY